MGVASAGYVLSHRADVIVFVGVIVEVVVMERVGFEARTLFNMEAVVLFVGLGFYLGPVDILNIEGDEASVGQQQHNLCEDVVDLVLHPVAEAIDSHEVRTLLRRKPNVMNIALNLTLYLAAGRDVVHIAKRGCAYFDTASFLCVVVRLVSYVGLVLGVVAVALNVYGIEKVIDAFHFFGSV